ncbi:hypothetical protein [Polyangium sp. y55x31]|uniref:hypothetical protein n=1 Tax=Polyangium sp. y55x31 TaxID=3042688 RepID=UPI002482EFA1|nr:hypothetical protein [Polyangium sp. y55x31]MDI1478412.1 hypothetical protein [Polyangium sp. y55x31]
MASCHDIERAKRLLTEATPLAERTKDDPTILRGGEVEEEQERTNVAIAQFEGEKETATPAPSPPTTSRARVKSRRWWLAAAALTLVFAGWALWRYYASLDEMRFCFRDGALTHCTHDLDTCEEVRGLVGPSAGPCQPISPTFP